MTAGAAPRTRPSGRPPSDVQHTWVAPHPKDRPSPTIVKGGWPAAEGNAGEMIPLPGRLRGPCQRFPEGLPVSARPRVTPAGRPDGGARCEPDSLPVGDAGARAKGTVRPRHPARPSGPSAARTGAASTRRGPHNARGRHRRTHNQPHSVEISPGTAAHHSLCWSIRGGQSRTAGKWVSPAGCPWSLGARNVVCQTAVPCPCDVTHRVKTSATPAGRVADRAALARGAAR
jgi:hypothetical protein